MLALLASDAASVSAVRLFEELLNHPIVTVASAMTLLGISKPTAIREIEALVSAGILTETTGRRRDRSGAATGDGITDSQAEAVKRLVPFQSYIGMRQVLDLLTADESD